jgi:hypothetical protein
MYTNRFIRLLIAISVLAVVVLVVREANATASLVANVDSATHSYTAWAQAAKAAEAETRMMDSATRSYVAQAKAVACSVDAAYGLNLSSATRSYIAWGLALQAKNDIHACH